MVVKFNRKRKLAFYKCERCNRITRIKPQPLKCICGHSYLKWLNYCKEVWDERITNE